MRLTTIVNIAAVAIGVILFGSLVYSLLHDTSTAPCMSRYSSPTSFVLKTDKGGPMSTEELQARAGIEEWGVRDNARVVTDPDGPPFAIDVALPEGTGSGYQTAEPAGGIGFRWRPTRMAGATSACLSYQVWLPERFDFAGAGTLPGLFGGHRYDHAATLDGTNGFASHPMWREEGAGELQVHLPKLPASEAGPASEQAALDTGATISIDRGAFYFPRGRWVEVEHEVVLNKPGESNGVARLWIDGRLKIERDGLTWRTTDALTLTGALIDASYGGLESAGSAPAATSLKLGGFEMAWR
jgi:hypothetical protein